MGTRRIRRKDGEFTLFFRKVSPFSNHHPAEFLSDGAINRNELLKFSCTEQFYMFNKASLLRNEKLMGNVLEANNPRAMKSMCSKGAISGWSDPLWDKHKEQVMYVACSAKFRSSRHLRYALFLSTGSRLIECSPFDSIWGIGKDIETAMKTSVNSGKNLLGNILDRVREELWNDAIYQDEREEVERRVGKDGDYLLNAMKHIDLIYKERARQRWKMAKGRFVPNEDYLTPEALQLIPEWALPPPLGDVELIQPSPPQIINFDRLDSPVRTHSASPMRLLPISQKSRLLGRLTVSELRPPLKRRTRSSSRSTFRSRSRSPIRKRRRLSSRSRSRSSTFSRSRSSSRESRRSKRKKSRRSKSGSLRRSSSRKRDKERRREKKRRHRSRSTSSTEKKVKKSRRSEDKERKHQKKRDRSRSRHRHHHHKKHKHRTESSERRRERRRQKRSESKETKKRRRRERSSSVSRSRSYSKEPTCSGDILVVL